MTRLRRWRTVLVLFVFSVLATGCLATPLAEVDPALVGAWEGTCDLGVPVVFDPTDLPEGVERTREGVPLLLTIHENATVDGQLGEAAFEECVLKSNRGELGRQLNWASDYIVIDGFLSGAIIPGRDETEIKDFTIPFNLVDNQIQGGLMWRQQGNYPYPLCSSVNLTKRE